MLNVRIVLISLSLSCCISQLAYADSNVIDNGTATHNTVSWDVGDVVLEDRIACEIDNQQQYNHCPAQRVFLGVTPEGYYQVQDFFKTPNGSEYVAYTDPYLLNSADVMVLSNGFHAKWEFVIGEYTGWHLNGQPRAQWRTENGKLEGPQIRWFSNGLKESESFFQNGELRGNSTRWSRYSGKKSLEYNCDFEHLNCIITSWQLDSGGVSSQSYLVDGKKAGIETVWRSYSCPLQIARQTNYKDGEKHGLEISWHRDGIKEYEHYFVHGQEDGVWYEWFLNGSLRREEQYHLGAKEGIWQQWYANGQKMEEIHYQNGLKNGPWLFWYNNGQKWSEVTYTNGFRQGTWRWWYPNGQLKREGYFSNGIRTGCWLSWDEQGTPLEEKCYQNGLSAAFTEKIPPIDIPSYEIDDVATAQARWRRGAIVLNNYFIGKVGNDDTYYHGDRTFLGISVKPDYCVVQDFYKEVDQKYTDPFLIYCGAIEEKIYNSGRLTIGTYVVWHPNGQRAMEHLRINDKSNLKNVSRAWDEHGVQVAEIRSFQDGSEASLSFGINSLTPEEALDLGMQAAVRAGWKYESLYKPNVSLDSLNHWSIFFWEAPHIDEQGRELFRVGGHGMIELSLDGEKARYIPGH